MIYTCGCPNRNFTSAQFKVWNSKPHEEVLETTPVGDTPRPPGWPSTWDRGTCSDCDQEIK